MSELKKDSASGVTIDGKTLEEILAEEEAKELGEQLAPDSKSPYHKTRVRHKEHKEKNSTGEIWSRKKINAYTWEKMVMQAKSIDLTIISALLSGDEVSGTMLGDLVMKSQGVQRRQYYVRMTHLLHKTDLGKLIVDRPAGKGKVFKLVTAALDCKPEELAVFIYKDLDPRKEILERYKALRPYVEEEPKIETEEKVADETELDVKETPEEKSEEEKVETWENVTEIDKPITTMVNKVIQEAVSQALGINVTVSGRVEVVFKFGFDR